jgi:hypothetical protein
MKLPFQGLDFLGSGRATLCLVSGCEQFAHQRCVASGIGVQYARQGTEDVRL